MKIEIHLFYKKLVTTINKGQWVRAKELKTWLRIK